MLPFMAMSDAIEALVGLSEADLKPESLLVYNVSSFAMSAEEFAEVASARYGKIEVTYQEDPIKQTISDSWPASIDDSLARKVWNWKPQFDRNSTFSDYMFPGLGD